MKTVTAREFQKNFGVVSDMVLSGEPVRVTKYGRPAYLILPENNRVADEPRRQAAVRLAQMLQQGQATDAAKALSFDDVGALIDECFA